MDKIKLSAMGLYPKIDPIYIEVGATSVEVMPYIPYEQMLDMIQWCIDYIINDRPFLSAPLKHIMKNFAILKFYTNFDFSFLETYHEMSEIYAEYDFIQRFDLMSKVIPLLDAIQMKFFDETLDQTLESIMKYRNSAVGIVDALAENAKNTTSSMQKSLDFIGEGENAEKMAMLMKLAEEITKNAAPQPPTPVAEEVEQEGESSAE